MLSYFNQTQKGIVSAIVGFGSFSIADTCAKWLGAHYDTFQIIFWTYLIALGAGLCFSPMLGGIKKTFQTTKPLIHIARGICGLVIAFTIVTALGQGLPLATLYTILFLAPFLITITAIPIYKEKVSRRNWITIMLGFSGILIAFHEGLAILKIEIIYALIALIAIVSLSLIARPLNDKTENLHALSFYPSLIVSIAAGIYLFPNITLPMLTHFPIFFLNGICVMLGLSFIAHGFKIAPYAIVAPIHYIQMVIAIIAGYTIFNDIPDIWMLLGAAIIILSGIIFALEQRDESD